MAATFLRSCSSTIIWGSTNTHPLCLRLFSVAGKRILDQTTANRNKMYGYYKISKHSSRLSVFAATEGSAKSSKSEETIPSWAKPDSDEPPPWARDGSEEYKTKRGFKVPFYVYLLASTVTAIAAIGSVFEYINQRPVFGILNSDSIFYAPLLGFFAFTGIPTSAFLWFKSVQAANKEAEEQDRRDGYM